MAHAGSYALLCDIAGCSYKRFGKSSLHAHKMLEHPHLHERSRVIKANNTPSTTKQYGHPFACDKCGIPFSTKDLLAIHIIKHTNKYPFACDFVGCDKSFSSQGELNKHKKTHTIEGQIRQKKQENRLNKKLKEWGYVVDCETTINALSGKCLTDTQRYFSRLDFRIVNCVNAICIIECDENSHFFYEVKCEMSRMADVRASLAIAGYTLPIYWIRYSPCGKYYVGSKQIKIERPDRENMLEEHLARVCSPDFTPKYQENVHYLFYDLVSKKEGPQIMRDPDFPDAMKELVSW